MLLQEHSSCLYRGENGKPFCLAELWPCTNTRHRSNILDLNACHILPLQIQLSGGLELKLHNFIHPALIVRIQWDFTINAVHVFQNTEKKIILVSQTGPVKFIFRSTEGQTFYWSLMTVDDSIKYPCANSGMTGQVAGFQNPGVCLQGFPSFLPHPLPALLLAPLFTRSLILVLFS